MKTIRNLLQKHVSNARVLAATLNYLEKAGVDLDENIDTTGYDRRIEEAREATYEANKRVRRVEESLAESQSRELAQTNTIETLLEHISRLTGLLEHAQRIADRPLLTKHDVFEVMMAANMVAEIAAKKNADSAGDEDLDDLEGELAFKMASNH